SGSGPPAGQPPQGPGFLAPRDPIPLRLIGMTNHDAAAEAGKVRRFEHPGKGDRRARGTPKGRQVDPHAKAEIAGLLGDAPRERTYLIEYLHRIQDRYKQISAAHLAALADEMR